MTETTRSCVRGCTMYREHYAECAGAGDGTCRGCLPQRARHGLLCNTCHRRFEMMLTDAPTVHRWLSGNMRAGSASSRAKEDYERSASTGEDVPAPVNLDVMDIRDLLADRLHCWVDDFANTVDVAKPPVPAENAPAEAIIEADVEFLLRWMQSLEWCEWIGDWWTELAETMSQAHALAPWRPALRRIKAVPCPGCEETNLGIFGGESSITCLSCRIIMTEDQFGLWETVLKAETEEAS